MDTVVGFRRIVGADKGDGPVAGADVFEGEGNWPGTDIGLEVIVEGGVAAGEDVDAGVDATIGEGVAEGEGAGAD